MAKAISIYHDQAKVVSWNDTDPGGNALCHIGGTSFRPGNAVLIPTPVFHGPVNVECKRLHLDQVKVMSQTQQLMDTGAVQANSHTTARRARCHDEPHEAILHDDPEGQKEYLRPQIQLSVQSY